MSEPERDEEFEAYLRRRSGLLNRLGSAQKLEPPDDLDDIVLQRARQAIQAPRRLPLYKAPRWALAVGLVAIILLSLSLVLNVSLNRSAQLGSRSPAATAARQAKVPDGAPTAGGAPTPGEAPPPAGEPPAPADPQAWLKQIQALRAAGKDAQADAQLRRFRAAFPGYPLAPDLTAVRPISSGPPK